MKKLLFISALILAIGYKLPAQAQPPLWQNNYGNELTGLTGQDDATQAINFPFPFPFNGNTYNMAVVGTNGCIQLNGLGSYDDIGYDYWAYMNEFLSDSNPDNPLICPFETDLSLYDIGTIYYNSSGDPLIISWIGVGTFQNTSIPSTFQILLYSDGTIVFNYNGMMQGGNFIDDLDEGIVVGVTPSDLPYDAMSHTIPGNPGPVNLIQGPFDFGPTAYELWCYNSADSCGVDGGGGLPGPVNTAFDLDFYSICFVPNNNDFSISSGFQGQDFSCGSIKPISRRIPTLSEWSMIAMAGILGLVGFMVIRRRKVTA